jgi:hypothetical protein
MRGWDSSSYYKVAPWPAQAWLSEPTSNRSSPVWRAAGDIGILIRAPDPEIPGSVKAALRSPVSAVDCF